MIISNPPYIDKNELELSLMGSDVKKYEPALALYASDKGMHFYIEILKQSFNNLKKNGIIIFEIGYNQEYLMKDLVMKYYIGTINGSGIEADNWDSFVGYLKDIAEQAEAQGEENFDVSVDVCLEGE